MLAGDALRHSDGNEGETMDRITDQLRRFLDEEGRLTAFPAKRRMKLEALRYLASKFEQGAVYTEKECNAVLNQWHTFGDPATLRRELYNLKWMDREPSGKAYWLEPVQPTLDELARQYG